MKIHTLLKMKIEWLFLPLVQGVTEFLPVSSSGHLFLAQHLLEIDSDLSLEIWLHGASLLAVLIYFRQDIRDLVVQSWRELFFSPGVALHEKGEDHYMGWKLMLATGVTILGVLGIQWGWPEWNLVLTTELVGVTLLFTAGMVLVSDILSKKFSAPSLSRDVCGTSLTWFLAVGVGLVQVLAIVPGISRSGVTLAFLLAIRIKRQEGVRLSFLLAIPTIGAALVYGLFQTSLLSLITSWHGWAMFVIGFVASWWGIVLLMRLVERYWIWFAGYCMVVGVLVLV